VYPVGDVSEMLTVAVWISDGVSAGAPAVGTDGGTVLAVKLPIVPPAGVALARAVITPGQYTSLVTMGVLMV